MATGAPLRLSSSTTPSQGGLEDSGRAGGDHSSSASLAPEGLVRRPQGLVGGPTLEDSSGHHFAQPGGMGPQLLQQTAWRLSGVL